MLSRTLLLTLLFALLSVHAQDDSDNADDASDNSDLNLPEDPSPNGGLLCDTIANCSNVGTEGCLAGKCVCLEDYTCADCSETCENGIWGQEDCHNWCTGQEPPPPGKKKRSDGEIAGIVIALLLSFAALMLFLQYMLSPMSMSKEAKAEARLEDARNAQVQMQPPAPAPSLVTPDPQLAPTPTFTATSYTPTQSVHSGYTGESGTVVSAATGYSGYSGTVPYDNQSAYSASGYNPSAPPSVYTPSAYTASAYTPSAYTPSAYTGTGSVYTDAQSSVSYPQQP